MADLINEGKTIDQDGSFREWQFAVEIVGELPYYVPISEEVIFSPSLIGARPFRMRFQHFQPIRHPDSMHGEGVDDKKGTFVRSKVDVTFPIERLPCDGEQDRYEEEALNLTNRALQAIKYVGGCYTLRRIDSYENCQVRFWQKTKGRMEPAGTWSEHVSFLPFGVTLRATFKKEEALNAIWEVFNELMPIIPSKLLVLDAKYHNAIGDIPRAILDLGTALDIHVDALLNFIEPVSSSLPRIETDVINIFQFYDEILLKTTGHTMHERPELFANLEYIRALRNSVTHKWKPEFQITSEMRKRSKYMDRHLRRQGHVVTSKKEVDTLIDNANEILKYVIGLFESKFGPFL